MAITATELRKNIYRVLDAVIETGEEVEIIRRGHRLRIAVAAEVVPTDRLEALRRLPPQPGLVVGDPEDLVEIDWSDLWQPWS